MNRHEQDQLLREILNSEEGAGFRGASLERALVEVRLRRRRRTLRISLLTSLPLLVVLALLFPPLPGGSAKNLASSNTPPTASLGNNSSREIVFINVRWRSWASPAISNWYFWDENA